MNHSSQNTILISLIIGCIVAIGIASSEDYNQAVVDTIPDEAYTAIAVELGSGCSNKDIIAEYQGNKEYYDNNYRAWQR